MSTKVVTGEVRFSYAHVWKPAAIQEGQEEKYSVALLIPKDDTKTLEAIEAAVEEAMQAGRAVFGGKIPNKLKLPLRDGDEERPDDEIYENCYFVNANSNRKPQIVDADVNPILNQDEFYSGCYGCASITFYAFSVSGNKGIACGLQNLQKTRDGEPLGGSASSAEEDFGSDVVS